MGPSGCLMQPSGTKVQSTSQPNKCTAKSPGAPPYHSETKGVLADNRRPWLSAHHVWSPQVRKGAGWLGRVRPPLRAPPWLRLGSPHLHTNRHTLCPSHCLPSDSHNALGRGRSIPYPFLVAYPVRKRYLIYTWGDLCVLSPKGLHSTVGAKQF